jgi:hypothetical protein
LTCSEALVRGEAKWAYSNTEMNRIGRSENGPQSFAGVLHEVMVYDRVLSQEEMEKLEIYLRKEWKE